MIQIALMPQAQGDKPATANPAEAGDLFAQATANGEIIGVSFDQALNELLLAQGEETVLLLSLPTGPGESMQGQAMQAGDGRVLPFSLLVDGKPLPFPPSQQQSLLTESGLAESALLKPMQPLSQSQSLQPGLLIQKLADTGQARELTLQLTDFGKQLVEVGRSMEPSGQLSLLSPQALANSSAGIRPSIVMPLDIPLGQPGWDRAMGERIQWMVGNNIQQAEIKLNPPNLGPLEIRISVQNDQTSVTFVTTQAPTREALEASIPRLREQFGEINLNLANVDVGQRQAGESQQDEKARSASNGHVSGDPLLHEQTPTTHRLWIAGSDGLLDIYA
ncbi:MAG: flagellar hook-length control protein FliK [Candidatus Thiodiazotropha sp.]